MKTTTRKLTECCNTYAHQGNDCDQLSQANNQTGGLIALCSAPGHGQSCIFMTLGNGGHIHGVIQTEINYEESIRAEPAANDDVMAQVLWTRHCLAAQGHYIPTTKIYQHNKSTILLAANGKISSSRRTRHLDVRYYKKGEVKVSCCLTRDMLGDFFTKLLQGTLIA